MSNAPTAAIVANLFINGESRSTAQKLSITDPGKPDTAVGQAAVASPSDVWDAIAAAQAAFPAWSSLSPEERADTMARALAGIAEHRDDDAVILSQEIGKIRHEAWVDSLVFEIRWKLALSHAAEVNEANVLPPMPEQHIATETTVSYQPLGVVTIIVPFNWPVAILGASLPQALLAGNTVIVKPPLTAPLGTTRIIQRIAEQLPPGVLNIVTGEDATMAGLIQDPRVAKACFTGSVNGGKKIMGLAAQNLTRLTLELGGNDPAIILEDAIIDDTHMDRLFAAIFDTTGQICMNAKRLFIHQSRIDEVVTALSDRLKKAVIGYGLDENTTMGPLHTAAQRQYVDDLIGEAKASGAKVLEFGTLPNGELAGGNFVRPALVINPDPSLRIVTEEQFGPVIPIIPFTSEDEVIVLANDTWSGLCGSVWTSDEAAASRIANQLICGYVWINDHGAPRLDLRAPFGGMKQSGFGREQGIEGIRAFQDTRAIARLGD